MKKLMLAIVAGVCLFKSYAHGNQRDALLTYHNKKVYVCNRNLYNPQRDILTDVYALLCICFGYERHM